MGGTWVDGGLAHPILRERVVWNQRSVLVGVVEIRVVGLDVDELLVVVWVGMGPVFRNSRGMPVLVVVVMPVLLGMLGPLVAVLVHMAFCQVQPDTRTHQDSCGRKAEGGCFTSGRKGHQHAHEGCQGEIGSRPGRAQLA